MQEQLLVNALSTNHSDNIVDFKTYEKYKSLFPKSVYAKELNKYFIKKEPKMEPYALAKYAKGSKKVQAVENKKYDSVEAIIKTRFNGKAVFVDFWVTHCGPCKKEFSHSEELHTFLKKQHY